jgi:endonuclease YncB( thermonuclease family)
MSQDPIALLVIAIIAIPFLKGFLRIIFRALFGKRLPKPFDLQGAYVIDGDTIAKGDLRIRLWGIDAPERGQRQGDASTQHLRALLRGAAIKVVPKDTDKYGRLVAQLMVDGQDISGRMVTDGYALACTQYSQQYARAMKRARRSKSGLWAQGRIENPGAWRKANA